MAGRSIVYWDACIFIAHLKNEQRSDPADMQGVAELVRKIDSGDLGLMTSVITLVEVLESSLTTSATNQFRDFLSRPDVLLVDVNRRIAEIAHELRNYFQNDGSGEKTIATPDAIHMATAISQNCPIFYTFDGDGGQKAGKPRALLQLRDAIAKKYTLRIQKPEPSQLTLDFPISTGDTEKN